LGTPKQEDWPGVELLPNYIEFQKTEPISLLPLFRQPTAEQSTNGIPSPLDLLMKLLELNPSKRITAKKVSTSTHILVGQIFISIFIWIGSGAPILSTITRAYKSA
jgi:hypothetical protein